MELLKLSSSIVLFWVHKNSQNYIFLQGQFDFF